MEKVNFSTILHFLKDAPVLFFFRLNMYIILFILFLHIYSKILLFFKNKIILKLKLSASILFEILGIWFDCIKAPALTAICWFSQENKF